MMRIYLHDVGIVSPLGSGKQNVLQALLENDQSGMRPYTDLLSDHNTWVGQVTTPLLPVEKSAYDCRNNQLLVTAYEQIRPAVEALKHQHGPERIAVILGTSTSGIASSEPAFTSYLQTGAFGHQFHYQQQEIGSSAGFLADYADLAGVQYVISTACSSSAKVMAVAQRLLDSNMCDAAVVGGADSLCQLTLNGFDSLDLVSTDLCQPMSANRQGLNIGEGATLFVVSKHKAPIYLAGFGETSDAHHISSPDPSGHGAIAAMQAALAMADITADDIGYINLHGTATLKNDAMESIAIYELFGDRVPCSSTKPLTGHTLGAAGAIELGHCWLLLSAMNVKQILPAHLYDQVPDPELPRCQLTTAGMTWCSPYFMSNSFAFGGSNASLIIARDNNDS